MHVDLLFAPSQVATEGGGEPYDVVIVIDVLRATSVMVALAARGARDVLLARSIDHARELKARLGVGWYTSGARRGVRVEGFDFANSIEEFSGLDLDGMRFILSTTNGTGTIYQVFSCGTVVLVGAILNQEATVRGLIERAGADAGRALVVLSGVKGRYSLDDGMAAGLLLVRLAELVPATTFGDEARTCLLMARGSDDVEGELRASHTGRLLADAGLSQEVSQILRQDDAGMAVQVVPVDDRGTLGLRAWRPQGMGSAAAR